MKTFDFFIDKKVTVWERNKYKVKADSFEEALEIMKKEFEEEEYKEDIYLETETLFETKQPIKPNEAPTKELYYEDSLLPQLIKTNYETNKS